MEKKSVELEEEEFGADARQAVFSTHSETLWGVVLHEVEAAGIVGAMGGKGFVVGLDKVEAVLVSDLPSQVQKRLQ